MNKNFTAVKIHIKEKPADFKRFKVQWTPTILITDGEGTEHHRLTGFLPREDFLAQISLGLAKAAFDQKKYAEAEQAFRQVVAQFPQSAAAPEAVYWAGVSAYKKSGTPDPLKAAGKELKEKYPNSEWAKKGSVWLG